MLDLFNNRHVHHDKSLWLKLVSTTKNPTYRKENAKLFRAVEIFDLIIFSAF